MNILKPFAFTDEPEPRAIYVVDEVQAYLRHTTADTSAYETAYLLFRNNPQIILMQKPLDNKPVEVDVKGYQGQSSNELTNWLKQLYQEIEDEPRD